MTGTNALAPLRYAPFRRLTAARAISASGSAVAPIALAFAVLDVTGSPADLGLVVAARSAANVAFLLLGGAVADRFPRAALLVGSNVVAGLSQAAVAVAVLTRSGTIPLLICLAVVNGVASALTMPAQAALVPQTVPDAALKQANALNRLVVNAATVAGASLGGVLVGFAGSGCGLAVDACSFLVAAVYFGLTRVPGGSTPAARTPLWRSLREGWSEFVARTWLWVVVAGATFYNAAYSGALSVLGPFAADQTIGRGRWGLVLAAHTIGLVCGGLVAIRLRVRRLLFFGVAAMFASAALPLLLALHPHLATVVPAAVLSGAGLEVFGVAWATTMQEYVPADRLARVSSYDMLGSFAAMPLGQAAAGPAAAALGYRTPMLMAATVMALATLAMLCSRAVRTVVHPRPEPNSAECEAMMPEPAPSR